MLKEMKVFTSGRLQYGRDPDGLSAASRVIAVAFATIAAANNCWR